MTIYPSAPLIGHTYPRPTIMVILAPTLLTTDNPSDEIKLASTFTFGRFIRKGHFVSAYVSQFDTNYPNPDLQTLAALRSASSITVLRGVVVKPIQLHLGQRHNILVCKSVYDTPRTLQSISAYCGTFSIRNVETHPYRVIFKNDLDYSDLAEDILSGLTPKEEITILSPYNFDKFNYPVVSTYPEHTIFYYPTLRDKLEQENLMQIN